MLIKSHKTQFKVLQNVGSLKVYLFKKFISKITQFLDTG